MRFGKPLDFSRYEGMENDRYILRSITDEIMYEIMRLSGQEYVDMYATRAKALAKEARPRRPPRQAAGDAEAADRRGRRRSRRPDRARPSGVRRPGRGLAGRGPAVPGAGGAAGRRAGQRGRRSTSTARDNFDHPVAGCAASWP